MTNLATEPSCSSVPALFRDLTPRPFQPPFDHVSLPDGQRGRPGRLSYDEPRPHPPIGMTRYPTDEHVAACLVRHEGQPLRLVILRDPVDGIGGLRVPESGSESCLGKGRVVGN